MKPNQSLVAILSAAAVTSGALLGAIASAEACPLSDIKSTKSAGASSDPLNSASLGTSGLALLGGLLVVGGVYLYRRSRQSQSLADQAGYETLEVASEPVNEQVERELVGSRK